MDPSLARSRRHIGTPIAPMTQNGMFSQKIQRQSAFSAKAPPMTGPMTDPIAHIRLMIAIHFPRSRNVTRSAITTYVRATRPPPPTPWILLPTSMVAIFLATEATMVPIEKIMSAARRTDWRPIICEKDAHEGWKTVEQSKKLVPHQKAWIAVPCKLVAMV